MKRGLALLVAAVAVVFVSAMVRGEPAGEKSGEIKVWLYWQTNIGSEESLAKSVAMVQRLAKAGYTGIAYRDNRLQRVGEWDEKYDGYLRKLRQACDENKIDLVAAVLPLGYANDLMRADPNLAEAIPVVDAPFVVKDGKLVSADEIKLVNGDFSQGSGNKLTGWQMDKPGETCFVDREVTYKGKPSLRMEEIGAKGEAKHSRVWQHVKVKPFQVYHLSVAMKTEDYKGSDPRLMAMGSKGGPDHGGRRLHLARLTPVKPTAEWVVYHKTFNTMEMDDLAVYVGEWGGKTGKVWFADVKIEPAGLSNLVRRGGAPFKATNVDGSVVYEEGKDLPEVKDPGLGKSGHSAGYQWHEGPTPTIPAGSRLKEGDKVLLSYSTTHLMEYNDQVPICMSEPKTLELIEKVVQHTQAALKPDYWWLGHDEIRMQGWDKSCTDTGKTPGGILADNIGKCAAILRKHSPASKGVFVWNDMFDPFHNAKHDGKFYEMCKGANPWDKSWEGLPLEMGLINWNAEKAESVKFFSERGNPQILSGPSGEGMVKLLERSGGLKGVSGAVYVTWSADYGENVEKFARAVREWKAKAR